MRFMVVVVVWVASSGFALGQERLDRRFDLLDRNDDAVLTPNELRREGLFALLDADGDGRITREEVRVGWEPVLDSRERRGAVRGVVMPEGAVVRKGIAYATMDGVDPNLLSLDVYAPGGGTGEALPVVVMIHGGGWRIGDKSNSGAGGSKASYFVREGWVYVSVNYRLSPAVRHPAHVEDVGASIAWVHANIADYGGDPGSIVVMGHSAGAHLAALVATDERRLGAHGLDLSVIKGVVLLDGAGYDIGAVMASKPGGVLTGMYGGAFGEDGALWEDASPIAHVDDGKGIPPFLILHIQRSTSLFASEALGEALVDAGVRAEVRLAKGKTHASINREIGREGDEVTGWVIGFLSDVVGSL